MSAYAALSETIDALTRIKADRIAASASKAESNIRDRAKLEQQWLAHSRPCRGLQLMKLLKRTVYAGSGWKPR